MRNILLSLIITILICPFCAQADSLTKEIRNYKGDGKIQDISFRHPVSLWLWKISGYEITFSEFDLNKGISKKYKLIGLPTVVREPYVYFKIVGIEIKEHQDIGAFSMRIEDSDENLITEFRNIEAKDMIWSSSGGSPCFEIYDLNKSTFEVEKNKEYTLLIEFMPSCEAISGKGSIYIKCGGYI